MNDKDITVLIPEPAVNQPSLVLTPLQDLRGFAFHYLGRFFLFMIACSSVIMVILIFTFVIKEAIPFLQTHSLTDLFSSANWYPQADKPKFGIMALVVGSLYVTIVAIVIAVPIGVLVAIFLSDITSLKIRTYIKPVIEILAAIPSVAYGFFAVLVLSSFMQNKMGFSTGANALNAAIILAIMSLPTIISVSEDALSAVPRQMREASYGLGATRFETIFKVVLPSAHSGIIAAIILGIMRAIGETMVVWMASGNANQVPHPWWNLTQSVRTMTASIAGEMGETPKDTSHYHALFFIGVTLLAMTFSLNLISEYFLASTKKKMG